MTKGHRTIVALLAVVAVLLGLNLIVNLTQEAEAAPPWLPPVDDSPTVVGMALGDDAQRVWRVWSDGVLETRRWLPDQSGGNGVCWAGYNNDWITVEECP